MAHVVIVGCGFGGLAAAQALRRSKAEVTLIDRTNHHLFQPLLYQVATAALSPADIATATRVLVRGQANLTVIMGEVTGINAVARQVLMRDTADVPYDFLVLATGAGYSFFGHDEWATHAWVLKSLDDATTIRSRLLGAFERAESRTDAAEIARLMTFVVVGGGPTGVELAGNIAELAGSTLARDFRRINPASAQVILCEAGERLLAGFTPVQSAYAATALRTLGVEVVIRAEVTDIDPQGLVAGGRRIEAANIFWAAGTQARPAAKWLSVAAAPNGGIVVDADCAVAGLAGVYAIGDVARQNGADGKPLPGLGSVAKQQGRYVGKLLAARLADRPPPAPFRYRDWGTLAVIGRSRAVATLLVIRMTGWPAWMVWSLVHLMLLTDFRSRASMLLNWRWSWLSYGRGARLVTRSEGSCGSKPATPCDP